MARRTARSPLATEEAVTAQAAGIWCSCWPRRWHIHGMEMASCGGGRKLGLAMDRRSSTSIKIIFARTLFFFHRRFTVSWR